MSSPNNSSGVEHRALSVSTSGLASEEDAAGLGAIAVIALSGCWLTWVIAKLGYKQELRRNFTMIEIFGISFSIMGLLPSIASVLVYSIPAGPAGMVWGWFLASGFIFVVGLAMVGEAFPRAGVTQPYAQ
ncbi:MAG: hypothetical protein Q9207_004505 [Kuettlingeria erythrocarpa]